MSRNIHILVDKGLLDELKKKMPELGGLTYTGTVDYLIRKTLKEAAK